MIKFLHKLWESLGLTNTAQTTYVEMAGDVADKVVSKNTVGTTIHSLIEWKYEVSNEAWLMASVWVLD